MKLSKLFITVVVLTMLGLTACGKKKNNSSAVNDGRNRGTIGPGTVVPNGSQQSGYLQNTSSEFQELVRALVSPTLDPQYIGQVDNYSGVRVAGGIELARSGSIYSTSAFRIDIHDSFVGQSDEEGNRIEAYSINVTNGQGSWTGNVVGSTVPTGSGNFIFQDEFGTIRIQGNWDTNYFQGTVYFKNNTSTFPTSLSSRCSQSECTLGQIQLPVRAFFR